MRSIPLTLSPNPVLDTGRVSYAGVIQLLPRAKGYTDKPSGEYVPSLRETIVARPDYVFSSEDYKAGELFTHAQSCIWLLGHSDLAELLLKDVDPHSYSGAQVLGCSYEEFIANKKQPRFAFVRQAMKAIVFGKPGGAGTATIALQQRSQGPDTLCELGPSMVDDGNGNDVPGYTGLRFCILMGRAERCGVHPDGRPNRTTKWGKYGQVIPPTCNECLQCVDELSKVWLKQWRENPRYFQVVEQFVDRGMVITPEMHERWPWISEWYQVYQQLDPGQVMQHFSGRLRGGLEFCALANGFFQALLADIARRALRRIARECYDATYRVPRQPYWNSRPSRFAGGQSPLYGSRPIGFFHDEIFNEHPESVAPEAAMRVSEIMVEEIMYVCSDVAEATEAQPTLIRRWYKQAEPVWHKYRPAIWTPEHSVKKCVECSEPGGTAWMGTPEGRAWLKNAA